MRVLVCFCFINCPCSYVGFKLIPDLFFVVANVALNGVRIESHPIELLLFCIELEFDKTKIFEGNFTSPKLLSIEGCAIKWFMLAKKINTQIRCLMFNIFYFVL
jgi:hypothetical protein